MGSGALRVFQLVTEGWSVAVSSMLDWVVMAVMRGGGGYAGVRLSRQGFVLVVVLLFVFCVCFYFLFPFCCWLFLGSCCWVVVFSGSVHLCVFLLDARSGFNKTFA